jgi:hypothetical protein
MDGSQFQSLAAARRGKNGASEAFEERFFAFQHVLIIVDARRSFTFLNRLKLQSDRIFVRSKLHSLKKSKCDVGQD